MMILLAQQQTWPALEQREPAAACAASCKSASFKTIKGSLPPSSTMETGAQIIPADATSLDDLNNLVSQSMEILGGKLDFVLHSIGMSVNVRKGRHYTDQKYDWTHKGWDVSAGSFHKTMQVLFKQDAMNQWGSIVALSYMAAQRVFPDYNDIPVLFDCLAQRFGPSP